MSVGFTTISITDHHRELLERNKAKIINFYKLEGDELQLLQVSAKIVPDSGTYYKFTVMDASRKTVIAKIDDLHSKAKWNSHQWVDKQLAYIHNE